MIKSELIQVIASYEKNLHEKDIYTGVNLLLGYLSDSLAKGERIEIRGFGSFSLHHHNPRNAHNPKTGEKVIAKEKSRVHFKPGKELRQRVDDSKFNCDIENNGEDND